MPDDEQTPDDDEFRPEAIAARVDRLGVETDTDRIAREEEQKLLARREQKKTGLETAASRRLNNIGETAVKRPPPVSAVAQTAPLTDRAAVAIEWMQENRILFGSTAAIAMAGLVAALGYGYWQEKRNADASALLAQALADNRGHLTTKTEAEDDESAAKLLYPTFKSVAERREAALSKYREVESKFAGTGVAILARLGEGSLLLDAHDAQGAKAAFESVKGSPLALADAEVRGRALEGIGFAEELLSQTAPSGSSKDKHLDAALSAYKSLEAVDINGFKELGGYHQVRVCLAKGDKAKAIELLKDLQKRISESGDKHPFSYLQFVVEDRLRELDPTALPPKPPKMPKMGGAGTTGPAGGPDMSDPKIQDLIRQLQQKSGGAPAPGAPQ